MVGRGQVNRAVTVAAVCFLAFALWNLALGWSHDDLGASRNRAGLLRRRGWGRRGRRA
jgi:hypothetical protein